MFENVTNVKKKRKSKGEMNKNIHWMSFSIHFYNSFQLRKFPETN